MRIMKPSSTAPAKRDGRSTMTPGRKVLTSVALVALTLALGCALSACAAPKDAADKVAAQQAQATAAASTPVTTPATASTETQPTMNKHETDGVSCIQCHGTEQPTSAPTSDEACRSCHDQATLVASTADLEDIPNRQVNPHDNHMHGTACTSCHSNHGASRVACNDCHVNEYNWMVP